jgi:4'-phosphopantetheinyl transferase
MTNRVWTTQGWEQPPVEDYKLSGSVHVWRVTLVPAPAPLRLAGDILDDEEHIRAARLRRPADRERFLAAHSALRIILARYLNELPERLRFVTSPQGKPALAPAFSGSRLRFNLAHSGDVALVAVAAGREVGVDVEQQRPLAEVSQISERYFSPSERDTLARISAADLPAVFFNIWSCKEAFTKAIGQGLGYSLASFSVPLADLSGQQPARVQASGGPAWGLRTLAVGQGYAGALVAEGLDWPMSMWQF